MYKRQGQTRACVCVLHYSAGTLQDKEYTFFHVTESDPAEVLSSFIKQYYAQRNAVAKKMCIRDRSATTRKRIVRHCHAAPSVELPICVAVRCL